MGADKKVDTFLPASSSVTPLQQAWRRQMFTTWFPRYLIWYRPFNIEQHALYMF